MEEALYDMPLYREFVGLSGMSRLPERVSILRFRHLLESHQLAEQFPKAVNEQLNVRGFLFKEGAVVDTTLIAAPSSTKNKGGEHDPEMHQTKKGNAWHFGMKAHIGVDADSGLRRDRPVCARTARAGIWTGAYAHRRAIRELGT